MMPVVLFCDDTSGNRSKKWHAFNSWYLIFAGLPHQENAKLPNLVFLCTSDKVSPLDMSAPIVAELEKLENEGIQAYDAHQQTNVLVITPVICIVSDNPRASDWWCLPPMLVPRVLRQAERCNAQRTLVVPLWESVPHLALVAHGC